MALRGTLDTFALPDVLRLLGATDKTGRLRITGDRGTGSVWVSGGQVCSVDATHAPHAEASVDALFELLRFRDGSFTFDTGATDESAGDPIEVEVLLAQSEQLLAEWREIEAVIPSMELWVSLRRTLPSAEVTLDESRWATIVAVGAGTTVRRVGDELCLGELPVSRAVKDLVEAGLAEITEAPTGGSWGASTTPVVRPITADTAPQEPDEPDEVVEEALDVPDVTPEPPAAPEPPSTPRAVSAPRARRARAAAASSEAPTEPGLFVPLDLPGHATAPSYDPDPDPVPAPTPAPAAPEAPSDELDELAASFPGLAGREPTLSPEPQPGPDGELDPGDELDDEELAEHLAKLSPRAAKAIRAAAASAAGEADGGDGDGAPLSRGLLLKFLSSVKS